MERAKACRAAKAGQSRLSSRQATRSDRARESPELQKVDLLQRVRLFENHEFRESRLSIFKDSAKAARRAQCPSHKFVIIYRVF
jgi:hypothetical protein